MATPTPKATPDSRIDSALLTTVLDSTHEHLLIADQEGKILRASSGCAVVYGITIEALCTTTVSELEQRGVLAPSVTLKVLATKRSQTIMQTTQTGRQVLAEGYPVFIDRRLVRVVSRSRDTLDLRHLRQEYSLRRRRLIDHLHDTDNASLDLFDDLPFTVRNPAMRDAITVLTRVAQTDAPILLLGESGVGKTMLAHQVHRWSRRCEGPFIDVNCAAIPEDLFESEMFGSMPGAFSGAPSQGRPGLLEQAEDGTLLLDEISELPLTVQAKLLKGLQEKKIMRLGDNRLRQLNFRLIAATNQDLARLVEDGRFRLDLFYRLNVVPVSVPPLRERREEIPVLVEQHMTRLNRRYGETRVVDESFLSELMRRDWPGNVRELENVLERQWLTGVSSRSRIGKMDTANVRESIYSPAEPSATKPQPLKEAVTQTERECLQRAMDGAASTYEIAERLQISQPSVVRKLKKHGLKLAMVGRL